MMKKIFNLTIPLVLMAGFAIAQTPPYEIKLQVADDVGGRQELMLGLHSNATVGFDANLGESELPPMPPSGIFEARFIGDDIGVSDLGQGSYRDYRPGDDSFVGTVTHEIRYQATSEASVIVVKWELPDGVTGTAQDLFGGAVVNRQMAGTDSLVVTNLSVDKLKVEITYARTTTSVAHAPSPLPNDFVLEQNFPNPFNPETTIAFTLPATHRGAATLRIVSLDGRTVREMNLPGATPGAHRVVWDGKDNAGLPVASGLYAYRLEAGPFAVSRRLVLMK